MIPLRPEVTYPGSTTTGTTSDPTPLIARAMTIAITVSVFFNCVTFLRT